MNKLQQEIKDFHERLKPTLEQVLELYKGKTVQGIYIHVIRPCRRLIQKCSFKSSNDAGMLYSLAYWLYIYEHKHLALKICEITHGVDFDIGYSPWGGGNSIANLYGLEIRIARELLGEKRNHNIPPELLDYFLCKGIKKRLRYLQVLRKEEEIYRDRSGYLGLFSELVDMIGIGETGLYAELNEHWEKVEETITEYIALLK